MNYNGEKVEGSTITGYAQGSLDDYRAKGPSKIDHIGSYLFVLCEVQKSGHDVHQEIDEALRLYREEAGF